MKKRFCGGELSVAVSVERNSPESLSAWFLVEKTGDLAIRQGTSVECYTRSCEISN